MTSELAIQQVQSALNRHRIDAEPQYTERRQVDWDALHDYQQDRAVLNLEDWIRESAYELSQMIRDANSASEIGKVFLAKLREVKAEAVERANR